MHVNMNHPSNESTRVLKSALHIAPHQSIATQTEPYEATELEPCDTNSIESSLHILSEKLNHTPTSSYANIRSIFYELRDIFKNIRQSQALISNQEHLKTCLQLAYECSRKLLTEQPKPHKSLACIQSTKAMFDYYLISRNAERAILALHLKFTDAIHHVEDDLASLLTENSDDATHHQASQTHLRQKRAAHIQSPVVLSSLQDLKAKWKTLSSKPANAQNMRKLFCLTSDVSQYVYHHKKSMLPAEKSNILMLALAVETRYLEQLQTSDGPIRSQSKSMQRAAQYCHLLAKHYQNEGIPELANKMNEKYQIMNERALDYARMLACRHVEQSKNTTPSEKERAKQRRFALKAELPENLDELCTQFQSVYDQAIIPERPEIQEQNGNVFFELYLEAHTYFEHIHYELLAMMHYDKPLLNDDPNLHAQQETIPVEVQAKLIAMLKTETGEKLQSAVKFYYEIKCKYYESVRKHYHQEALLEAERFQAAFQKQAYELLLPHTIHPQSPENTELFRKNCEDILNARHYSTPLIHFMAQHQLNIITAHIVNEEISPQPDTSPTPSSRPKINKPSPKIISAPTDTNQTIWEHICSEYPVRPIDFATYLETIEREQGPTDTLTNTLFAAITDSNKHLLIDEGNIDAFYSLYHLLIKQYVEPQEKKILEALMKKHALAGNLEPVISEDKLMVKSLAMIRGVLHYGELLHLEQKAELFFMLGNIYAYLQSLSPKRIFKDEGTASYKRLQRIIDALDDASQANWDAFNLDNALLQLTPMSSFNARLVIANKLSDEEKQQNTSTIEEIFAQTRSLESSYETLINSAHHHTFISQIHWMLSVLLTKDRYIATKTNALRQQVKKPGNNVNTYFFAHLYALLKLCETWLRKNVEASEHQTYGVILKNLHEHLLTAYAKINDIAEEQQEQLLFALCCKTYDDALPKTQECIKNNISLIRKRIHELEGHTLTQAKIEAPKLDKPLILPLEVPETFRTHPALKPTLTLIENKKYWQVLLILGHDGVKIPEAFFLQARLHTWLLNMICSNDFQALLDHNDAVQSSYAFTKKHLEQQRLMFLNKASRKPCLELCKQERKKTPQAPDTNTPFRLLGLFSTNPDEKHHLNEKDENEDEVNPTAKLGSS